MRGRGSVVEKRGIERVPFLSILSEEEALKCGHGWSFVFETGHVAEAEPRAGAGAVGLEQCISRRVRRWRRAW